MLAQESVVVFLLNFLQKVNNDVHNGCPVESLLLCYLDEKKIFRLQRKRLAVRFLKFQGINGDKATTHHVPS
jgi:hypothetical protein